MSYQLNSLLLLQDLYHQHCQNVCIMFAAIPDFKVFFSTVDVTGHECLRLLNEIISVFDKVAQYLRMSYIMLNDIV